MIKIRVEDKYMYAIIENNIENIIPDIEELITIQNKFLESDYKRLIFQFADCRYINAAVSVIIGTLPVYAIKKAKSVKYRFTNPKDHPILSFMKSVGMYKYFMNNDIDYTGIDVIPFSKIEDENKMKEYAKRIMSLAPIRMQQEAQDILSSYIYEIYQNGLFHSDSPIGVFTSGYWDRDKKEFTFSIYDMGVGIPNKIRKYLDNEGLTSKQCLKISFIDGFSTNTDRTINRGLGLTRLENFIRLNRGSMSIYTDNVCCSINEKECNKYKELTSPIIGTLIIIKIVADEKHIYVVEKEKKNE